MITAQPKFAETRMHINAHAVTNIAVSALTNTAARLNNNRFDNQSFQPAIALKKLSNLDLEHKLKNLVSQERSLLHEILLHIKEVDRRRLYLDHAYPSLFEFLTTHIGYSASSAQRRIEAARLLHTVPALAEKIQAGSLNLTQVGEFTKAIKQKEKESFIKITPEVKHKLLAQIENKSFQETQKLLAQELDLTLKPMEKKQVQKDESVYLQITLTKEQYEKLIKCKNLSAHKLMQNNQGTGLAHVIEIMADQYLEKKLGTNKCRTRTTGAEVETEIVGMQDNLTLLRTHNPINNADNPENKTLTPKTKQIILNEQKCCQYKDLKTGKICKSTFALEIDHKQSRWAGGSHNLENLQVLCAQHNKLKYRQETQMKFS